MGDESNWRNIRFYGSTEGSAEVSGPLWLHSVINDGTSLPREIFSSTC